MVAKKTGKATTTKKADAPTKTPAKKTTVFKEPLTKSQVLTHLSESTELSKKQVSLVLDELGSLVERSLKARSAGSFTLPGLLKITSVKKPAKKARKGTNPFTGEETTFKAKPAHWVVKIRALKKLKDMVAQ